jgi:hypothetical protein
VPEEDLKRYVASPAPRTIAYTMSTIRERREITIHARVERDLAQNLERLAASADRSLSDYIRLTLRHAVNTEQKPAKNIAALP